MRINPVQNYYCPQYTNNVLRNNTNPVQNQNKTVTPDSGQISALPGYKFYPQISFTGTQSSAIELVKRIPLEDRLASVLQVIQQGDVVVIDKTLKSAQKSLKEIGNSFHNIIKRLFYIEDDTLNASLALFKNYNNELEAYNPNKFDFILKSGDSVYNMSKGDSFYLETGDVLKINDRDIQIKDKPLADLSMLRNTFVRSFDFSNEVNPVIKRQNQKSISSILTTLAGKGRKLSFADVGGQDGVISALKKGILYPIKYPEAYKNSIVNHGYVLYGPPGTGKTLIAQALANETNASFIKLNGLEMESKWVGQSEENWRKLFDAARESQPSIIFIDEFDAVAKKRGGADVYGDKVVNQLLTLMSDVEKNGDDIFVVTATNRLDMLDSAITRSGRFGKHIEVKAPDTKDAVLKIFDIHTKNKVLEQNFPKDKVAEQLLKVKATGADIAHIVNSAHERSFERAGIYEKMENGTFKSEDIENLRLTFEDFTAAINDFSSVNKQVSRKPIGFASYNNKN